MRPLRLLVGSMHVTNWNSLVPQAAYEEGNPVSGHGATEICRIAVHLGLSGIYWEGAEDVGED